MAVDYTAFLVKPGAIQWDTSGEMMLTDIYGIKVSAPSSNALTPAAAWRPLGWDVSYTVNGTAVTKRKNVGGIPERNSAHPNYSFMRATNIRWQQPDNTSCVWLCEVEYRYSPQSRENNDAPDSGDPVKVKFVDVEFYSHNISVPLSFSQDGYPLCNSAGEPITPEPTIDVVSPCLRITARNQRAPTYYAGYMGSINSAAIVICGLRFPKYCARMTYTSREIEMVVGGTESEPVYADMYEHEFCIEGNLTPAPSAVSGLETYDGTTYAGWMRLIPDMGYSYLDANGVLTRAQVQSQSDPTLFVDSPLPVALDANGHLGSSIRFFQVAPGPTKSWAPIGFPATW